MKNRTVTTSIFTASLGLTLLAGVPAATAAPTCPDGTVAREYNTGQMTTVITSPATTTQRLVTPAQPAVVEVQFEYMHTKNDKQPNRWMPEGWNAEGNPNSDGGWKATGATREVEVSPATPAVYETVHIPATTAQVPVTAFECTPQNTDTTGGGTTNTGGGNTNTGGGNTTNTGGTGEAAGTGAPTEVTPVNNAQAALNNTQTPTANSANPAALPVLGVNGSASAATEASAAQTMAYTGAEGTATLLIISGLALGTGAALFGTAKLRTRRTNP